jgi:hypothetical protein
MAALTAEVVRLRIEWVRAIIALERRTESQPDRTPDQLSQDTDYASARIERIVTRDVLDRRPPALSNSKAVKHLRSLFSGDLQWQCVEAPEWGTPTLGGDSKTDGPAMTHAAGCLAQQLFAFGDYAELDSRLQKALHHLHDLPDGTSTLAGLTSGLDNLFTYGGGDPRQLLTLTSDWRRTVPGSIEPDLAESMIYEAWAWRARGTGSFDSVSAEGWWWFRHRSALAAAGLEELTSRATQNPSWYVDSIHVGLDRNLDKEELRAIFDAGVKQAPGYLPLYRAMLRSLMPRWGGSARQIDVFIEAVTDKPGAAERDTELYARLYWSYDSLEQGDIKLFDDSLAVWPLMKSGFAQLVEHYPHSDALLNAYAKFACIGEDAKTYRMLRPSIETRRASTVWSRSATVESCDFHFPTRPGPMAGP